MKKIGITGSVSSGKSTATKILAQKSYPIFSADMEVKKLYEDKKFIKILSNKFKLQKTVNIKKKVRTMILSKRENIEKLEKLIHPLIRKKMRYFAKKNKKRTFIFFEIPLLVESKLLRFFDLTIFISSSRKLRLKRYLRKGGKKSLFKFLDKRQANPSIKKRKCDFIVVNNTTKKVLKKNLLNILNIHE